MYTRLNETEVRSAVIERVVCFFPPQKPERDEWGSGLEAMQCALLLEKSVNQALLELHKLASEHVDPHVSCRKRGLMLCSLDIPTYE